MNSQIQLRRGTASQWTSANSILNSGEIGVETDTGKFKIGNGSTAWSSLSYSGDVTLTGTQTLTNKTLASPTFTGTVSGITKTMVGLGNVDNTSDASKPVSTATQTALNLKADLSGPTFTGTVVLPSTTSIGNVSSTELGYLDGVTSNIQTQLDSKVPGANEIMVIMGAY